MPRKYPIGLQSFRSLREDGFLYIDKTECIYNLIETGNYFFLSRPRRFGKSLMLDTISEIFKGSRELFQGLWIHDRWNWNNTNPVIHLRLSKIPYRKLGLYNALFKELDEVARELNVELTQADLKSKFWELIQKSATDRKVVILVDEYDKPIIDFLNEPETLEENRTVFKDFYSVLKDADQYIRFLLLSGVSRFSKVSIFSDLNHLRDITMNGQFDDLIGITQQELEKGFSPEIAALQLKDAAILDKIKKWYNGYSWGGVKKVYNPFSILNFMTDHEFNNYWFQTGTPTFFFDMIRRNPALDFPTGEVEVGMEGLIDLLGNVTEYGGPSVIRPVTIMFQTGYLTVKHYDSQDRIYTLDFPNLEVKESMEIFLLGAYSQQPADKVRPNVLQIARAFRSNDIARVMLLIDTLFADIPNTLWANVSENFYHAIMHNTFSLLDIFMESDRNYAGTRPDITLFTKTHIYVLELKLNGSADAALNQIIEKDYFRPFQLDTRTKVAIGINFSSEKKAIDSYMLKEI